MKNNTDVIHKLCKQKFNILNLIRKTSKDIVVPPVCLVNYFGIRYVVYAITPITRDTLDYGTITQNLIINENLSAPKVLQTIANEFNIENHVIYESGTDTLKNVVLTNNLEIHKIGSNLVLTDLEYMCPTEYFDYDTTTKSNLPYNLSRFIRIETLKDCHESKLDEDWCEVATKDPPKCSNCHEYIRETEYLYFEKKSLANDKKVFKQFYCCLSCFETHKNLDDLKVPISKLEHKAFPKKKHGKYWLNIVSGECLTEPPYVKLSLNPDVYWTEGKRLPIGEKNNRKKHTVSLKNCTSAIVENRLKKLTDDFNKMEEMVYASSQLEKVMHERGISLRYFGKLASGLRNNFLREVVVRDMLARSMKIIIRNSMESLRELSSKMTENQLKKTICYYLNIFFNFSSTNHETIELWDTIAKMVKLKFNLKVTRKILQNIA